MNVHGKRVRAFQSFWTVIGIMSSKNWFWCSIIKGINVL
jgi:hypothetical protein